jgi:hypothetical protein
MLITAMHCGRWPRSSVACLTLPALAAFDGMWLELFQPENLQQLHEDCLFGLRSAGELFGRHSGEWHVYAGGSAPGGRDLPWLDLDNATVIAIGADDGDDTWILLDYRTSPTDPRVVFNRFSDRWGHHVVWDELAPTLTVFLDWIESAPRRPLPHRD